MNRKHGYRRHPVYESLYNAWLSMKKRCGDPKNKSYNDYGGRGISVCQEWQEASNFIAWGIKAGWMPGLTLERIDVEGNYCPENCTFIPARLQSRNRRRTIWIEFRGERISLAEACERHSIKYDVAYHRLRDSGWAPEKAILTPVKKKDSSTTDRLIKG